MGTRSNVLCAMGLTALSLTGGCTLARSGLGACGEGPCSDAGIMSDAWVGDGDVRDSGHDAFVPDADAAMMMADAGDADMPDAYIPDSGMDGGSDGGTDGGSDAGTDGGPPPVYLNIRLGYTGTPPAAGFMFRVAWNEPPPVGAQSSIWYTDVCDSTHAVDTGAAVICNADVPELMPTRTVDIEPVDRFGTPVCGATSCPGALTDWTFTYGGAPVPAGSVSLLTGPASPPPTIAGNPAYLRISSLPTP